MLSVQPRIILVSVGLNFSLDFSDCSDKVLSNGHLLKWNINCQSTVQPSLRTEARITFFTTKPVAKESFATTEPKNKSQDTGRC